MQTTETIVDTILTHLPSVQAIYLFGTWGTPDERPASDVDIAVLLPPQVALAPEPELMGALHVALESVVHKTVDMVNLRRVSTVFQNEIVSTGRRIYSADHGTADEFEMLTLSLYQKLNAERADILQAARQSGRLYNV